MFEKGYDLIDAKAVAEATPETMRDIDATNTLDSSNNIIDSSNVLINDENNDGNNDGITEPRKLIKEPNLIKKLEFVLNVQEIPGKKIAQNYIKNLIDQLNNIKNKRGFMQYNIRIITDSDVEYGKMLGGGDGNSTFPYNVFETTLNTITGTITSTRSSKPQQSEITNETVNVSNGQIIDSDKTNPDDTQVDQISTIEPTNNKQSIFQKLFSYIPVIGTPTMPTVDASFTIPPEFVNLVQEPIEFDNTYDGVLHILVTIYDKTDYFGYVGGLIQLESWIKKVVFFRNKINKV